MNFFPRWAVLGGVIAFFFTEIQAQDRQTASAEPASVPPTLHQQLSNSGFQRGSMRVRHADTKYDVWQWGTDLFLVTTTDRIAGPDTHQAVLYRLFLTENLQQRLSKDDLRRLARQSESLAGAVGDASTLARSLDDRLESLDSSPVRAFLPRSIVSARNALATLTTEMERMAGVIENANAAYESLNRAVELAERDVASEMSERGVAQFANFLGDVNEQYLNRIVNAVDAMIGHWQTVSGYIPSSRATEHVDSSFRNFRHNIVGFQTEISSHRQGVIDIQVNARNRTQGVMREVRRYMQPGRPAVRSTATDSVTTGSHGGSWLYVLLPIVFVLILLFLVLAIVLFFFIMRGSTFMSFDSET